MDQKIDHLLEERQSQALGNDYYALVLYLFLIFFAPQERYEWLNIIRPAFSVAIIAAIFYFVNNSKTEKHFSQTNPLQGFLLILFLLSMFITNSISPFSNELFPYSFIELLKRIILYFLIIKIIKTEKQLEAIIKVILIFGSIITIYTLLAYKFSWGDIHFRMVSPFGGMGSNSNGFAMFLLGLLPFFAIFFIKESTILRKIVYGILIFGILMCIIKTRSRMGFLGIIFQFCILGWDNKKNIGVIILLFLIVSIAGFRANENLWERVDTITKNNETIDIDSASRENKWRQALFIIQKHPFTGVGISQFRTAVKHYDLGESEHIVHNAYLEIGAECGLFSMTLFLACLLSTIFTNRSAMKIYLRINKDKLSIIANILFLSSSSFAFCIIFLSEQFNSMLFILLGLSGVVLKLTTPSKCEVR